MADIVISGAGGFIGRHLTAAFSATGLTAASYRDFRDGSEKADTFVHCANIHADPRGNAAFTADVLATVGGRVKRFVQLQSFATLHGLGQLDPQRFNFGKSPLVMAPYGLGKLLQEQAICTEAARHPKLAVRLLYLPVVLGEGGSWSRVRDQAKRNGVVLPPRMSGAARVNYIEVGDVARHLVDTHADVAAGLTRTVLNRPDSANLVWEAFFTGAKVTYDGSPKSLVKLAVTGTALCAYRLKSALMPGRIPPGTTDRRPPHTPAHPADAPAPQPVRFTGLIQHIVRTQPYLAASQP
ncbi:MAG TPA: NAD-dependent epimerase/dehydratase family protein [Xanthobacteraceae bacterium]